MARLPAARPLFAVAVMLLVLSSTSSSSYPCPGDPSSVSKYRVTVNANHSLQEVARMISNHTLITINTSWVIISSPVEFSHLSGITLDGQGATITCSSAEGGLVFHNMQQLCLTNFTLSNCSMLHNSTNQNVDSDKNPSYFMMSVAAYINRCQDLVIRGIRVANNSGIGMVILDANGTVLITGSHFTQNKVRTGSFIPGGGGLYIEFTLCPSNIFPGSSEPCRNHHNRDSNYRIEHCTFMANEASVDIVRSSYWHMYSGGHVVLGSGGGMAVFFNGNASSNTITIDNCLFIRNRASISGGGLRVLFNGQASQNNVIITRASFEGNTCRDCTGGGATLSYLGFLCEENTMVLSDCNFTENSAVVGGGLYISSTRGRNYMERNKYKIENCEWNRNVALYGAAIDIRPQLWHNEISGYPSAVLFFSCSFSNNRVLPDKGGHPGTGILYVTGLTIEVMSSLNFTNNNGSAICLDNAILQTTSECYLKFIGNFGYRGGALSLSGSAWISIRGPGDVTMVFVNNTAQYEGGAIAAFFRDKVAAIVSHLCFIQCLPRSNISDKVTFVFQNNRASLYRGSHTTMRTTSCQYSNGNIAFANTMQLCKRQCQWDNSQTDHQVERLFGECTMCNATVHVLDHDKQPYSITSLISNITIDQSEAPLPFVPGKETVINLQALDEFGQKKCTADYKVSLSNAFGKISLDHHFSDTDTNTVRLFGDPGSKADLTFASVSELGVVTSAKVRLVECPPGYFHSSTNDDVGSCVCGSQPSHAAGRPYYSQIRRCNNEKFSAILENGAWGGYINESRPTPKNFRTATCPYGYCNGNRDTELPSASLLLDNPQIVCANSRKGLVCGECSNNTTVFFHSDTYHCGETKLCSWGPVFYLLSELLPLTLFFLIVIGFSIDFSTGGLSSFILFAQIQSQLLFGIANININSNYHGIRAFYWLYNIIYGFFNLEFFRLEPLAFCVWNGATPLDMQALLYVSTLYALLLVIGLVIIFNCCSCCLCWHRMMLWKRKKGLSVSVTHGIVTFLTLCYAKCSKTTFCILTISHLKGVKGGEKETRVYYYALLDYFSSQHLIYAIPALVILVTFVIIPPLLLMAYPVCYQVMSLCHVSETRVGLGLTRWIEKLKPLLDAFQSCFKDRFRFTAGLYFLYRIFVPAVYAVTNDILSFYSILEIFFVCALTFHCIIQPYLRKRDNIFHALILANLAIINGLYMYNYTRLQKDSQETKIFIAGIQLLFIFLPLLVGIGYLFTKFALAQLSSPLPFSRRRSRQNECLIHEIEEEVLPARLLGISDEVKED